MPRACSGRRVKQARSRFFFLFFFFFFFFLFFFFFFIFATVAQAPFIGCSAPVGD